MLIHRGKYIQRGGGFFQFVSSLVKKAIPVVKSIFGAPVTQRVLKKAKNSAINAGLNLAGDTLKGENVKDSFKSNLKRVGKDLGSAVTDEIFKKDESEPPPKKRSKKSKKKNIRKVSTKKKKSTLPVRDLFDD